MLPRFELGKVTIKEEAAYALAVSGQDASFFLDKHAGGDWGEGNPDQNDQGLREGSLILSRYRTLWGHEILVATFPDKRETCLFCPPNSVIKYVPLPDLACWGPTSEGEGTAMKHEPGNGSSRFEILQIDMGGWVRVHAVGAALPEELPVFLAHTLAEWFRQRPQFHLRFVVPFQKDGTTVELHAWYDVHVFPATPQAPQPLK